MGRPRIPRRRLIDARVTPIGEHLMLVSVPITPPPAAAKLAILSASERAVIELALAGYSNAEIARRRGASPRTIANQLGVAYAKLGVKGRRQLLGRFSR